MSLKSIQFEIALWASVCLIMSGMVIVAYAVTTSRATAIRAAEERSLAEARIQAGIVKAEIEIALDTARARAQELTAVKQPENPLSISREQVNAMMRQVLVESPQYIGVWTLWEPDAFDGQDARYANTTAYGKTGRYFPYWNRGTGTITVEPIVHFDAGDWYQEPKKTRQEYVTDIYTYPVMGQDTWMISVVAPIVVNDVFYGVAGEDIPATFLQEIADRVNIYEGAGKLFLIGNNGKLVAATGRPELRGRALSEVLKRQDAQACLTAMKAGRERVKLAPDHLEASVPIHFGRTTKLWAALIMLPAEKITAPANALMWRLMGISLLMILAGVGALWLVAGKLARPIRQVTQAARQVAAGDLTQTVTLGARSDELGVLAQDFNHMTRQLRSLYNALEQRVVELNQTSQELRKHRDHLEELVSERTADLVEAKERAERANRAKSVFLSNMSHELRTPLNAVLGFSQLMQHDRQATADQKEYLNIINRSGAHLLHLINNVLDISKIEAGRVTLEESQVDLHQMVQELTSLMYVRAYEKGLDFTLAQSPDLPRQIVVDGGKLRQVLLNLIGNAIKYTTQGGVTLRVWMVDPGCSNLDTGDQHPASSNQHPASLRFEVEDTGPGIRLADRERIFLPFVQLEDRPTTDAGTGLGLAICKQYVDLMDGTIRVAGEPGRGSVFHVELPAAVLPFEASSVGARRGRVLGLAAGQPRYRLLIAEDQPENRLLLSKLLAPFGFDLREAVNGKEAVDIFAHWQPDLIWMDMRMPVMDGLAATRQIKATEAGARTRIVAVTAHALEEERREILAAGCDDFIRKPYQNIEILDALTNNLGVRFTYEDETTPAAVTGASNATALADLPDELRHDLEQALVRIDIGAVHRAIDAIRAQQPALAEALAAVASDLQFGRLLRLIRAAHTEEPSPCPSLNKGGVGEGVQST